MRLILFIDKIKVLLFLTLLIFGVSLVFAQDGLAQATLGSRTICGLAIQKSAPKWEVDPFFSDDVELAKSLGLSERRCARITNRFSERVLRSSSDDRAALKNKRVQPDRGTASKPSNALKKLRKTITAQEKRIQSQQRQIKSLTQKLTKSDQRFAKRIKALERNIKTKASQSGVKKQTSTLPNLSRRVGNLEKEFKVEVKEIKSQNDTILNNIGKWQGVIPRLETSVTKLKKDIIKGISSKAPQTSQRSVERLQEELSVLTRKVDLLEKTLKVSREEKAKPQQQSLPEISEMGETNSLLWLIPMLLLLCAFGVIIVVLVRKNSEARRQLEDSLRNANRNKGSGVVNDEKPDKQ